VIDVFMRQFKVLIGGVMNIDVVNKEGLRYSCINVFIKNINILKS